MAFVTYFHGRKNKQVRFSSLKRVPFKNASGNNVSSKTKISRHFTKKNLTDYISNVLIFNEINHIRGKCIN